MELNDTVNPKNLHSLAKNLAFSGFNLMLAFRYLSKVISKFFRTAEKEAPKITVSSMYAKAVSYPTPCTMIDANLAKILALLPAPVAILDNEIDLF
jgi:hypothetical protein